VGLLGVNIGAYGLGILRDSTGLIHGIRWEF
jgi:hypothetical protein